MDTTISVDINGAILNNKDRVALYCLKRRGIGDQTIRSIDLEKCVNKNETSVETIMNEFGFPYYKAKDSALYRLEIEPMGNVVDHILELLQL